MIIYNINVNYYKLSYEFIYKLLFYYESFAPHINSFIYSISKVLRDKRLQNICRFHLSRSFRVLKVFYNTVKHYIAIISLSRTQTSHFMDKMDYNTP